MTISSPAPNRRGARVWAQLLLGFIGWFVLNGLYLSVASLLVGDLADLLYFGLIALPLAILLNVIVLVKLITSKRFFLAAGMMIGFAVALAFLGITQFS